jgi:hypothetical protein
MDDELFHARPTLKLGVVERVVALAAGAAAYVALDHWTAWSLWLKAACTLCAYALAAIGMFLAEGALEVRALRKRGLPIID